MLIAMLTVFLLGGGLMGGSLLTPADVELTRTRLESAIPDAERKATATQIVDELEAEIEAFDQVFFASGDSLRALYLDHDAGPRRMQTMLEALNLEWYASQNRGLTLRERLRETVTAEEWTTVFPGQ